MLTLFNNLSQEQADIYSLTLLSSGITCRIVKKVKGWELLVRDKDFESALDIIEKHLEENPEKTEPCEITSQNNHKTYIGLWAAALLLASHIIFSTGKMEYHTERFGASASHILNGEFFRTVTALMIHSDSLHLFGNMAGIALFATAVCSITGWGLGCLMILTSGIIGNTLNAVFYGTRHLSVGASTAVFGALGILAGFNFLKKFKLPRQKMKSWLPIGAGIALLGLFSSGENTDIMAHLLGFTAGLILGTLYFQTHTYKPGRGNQSLYFFTTVFIIAGSWCWALFYV